jgi:hypothetical protein
MKSVSETHGTPSCKHLRFSFVFILVRSPFKIFEDVDELEMILGSSKGPATGLALCFALLGMKIDVGS